MFLETKKEKSALNHNSAVQLFNLTNGNQLFEKYQMSYNICFNLLIFIKLH